MVNLVAELICLILPDWITRQMKAIIQNQSHVLARPCEVKYCSSFHSKLLGLMFRKEIKPFTGIILVEKRDSLINSSIHMLFMNFDISAIWVNKSGVVVDKTIARRWHLAYAPREPANRVIELHPRHINDFHVGDQITYEIV
jgi:uncharacterized membrane protein (UPF0127 family)